MGSMTEEKKRFPWRLIGCAVLAVLLAAVVGFIETAGREGTVIGRYERIKRIKHGASEAEIVAIMGKDALRSGETADGTDLDTCLERADGLGRIRVTVATKDADIMASPPLAWVTRIIEPHGKAFAFTELELAGDPPFLWRCRRWAEQAYTTIHGPRR
jgi:hypothetical protein